MTVTGVTKDPEALTMTLTAEFAASTDVVWRLIAEPRLLERWWGPPGYPATFADFSLVPGEHIGYFMTGPDGERFHGWWKVRAVDPPRILDVEDGFADADGVPDTSMPTGSMRLEVGDLGGGRARLTILSTFASLAAMEQLVAMGQEEGMTLAVGQMDALVAELLV